MPAFLTRTGVFVYRNPDGSKRREYRPAEEVFRADSLASLADAPVTDRHPQGGRLVDASNYRAVARGHLSGEPRQDEGRVAADLVIQDATLVGAVERRDRTEVSCGYTCRTDATPGRTDDGEEYDVIQRDIVYNHVAIVENGRAGREIALRLDSEGNEVTTERRTMLRIRIDGVEYPLGTEAEQAAAVQAYERYQARLDSEAATLRQERDAAVRERDEAKGRADAAEKAAAEAQDPKRFDAEIDRRVAFRAQAEKLGVTLGGRSEREVMVEAIRASDPEARLDDASEDYLRGRFEALTPAKPKLAPAKHPFAASAQRTDTNESPLTRARRQYAEAMAQPPRFAVVKGGN